MESREPIAQAPRYKGTCLYCGGPTFAYYKSQLKSFCSHTCSNRWKWENVRKRKSFASFTCPNCNSEVLVDVSDHRVKGGQTNFFCSNECWKEYCSKRSVSKTCDICGTTFFGKNSYCCKSCSIEASKWHNFEKRVGAKLGSYREYLEELEKMELSKIKEREKKLSKRRYLTDDERREKRRAWGRRRRQKAAYALYIKNYLREYNKKHRESRNEKERERMANDKVYKFKASVRKMIGCSFSRKGFVKSRKSELILGCTIEEFMAHLESKFTAGMSFENHGEWHIDHIVPLATAETEDDVIRLCHYTNLQPLWARDNISKGSRIINK